MYESWMGRYREFIAALVYHTNSSCRQLSVRTDWDDISLSSQEWQILEYIVEHSDDDSNMIHVSERLGIPQSSFSKQTKALIQYGLVEKYQRKGNKKNIILKASPFGLEQYKKISQRLYETVFSAAFNRLEELSDDQLKTVAEAIYLLTDGFSEPDNNDALIKIR